MATQQYFADGYFATGYIADDWLGVPSAVNDRVATLAVTQGSDGGRSGYFGQGYIGPGYLHGEWFANSGGSFFGTFTPSLTITGTLNVVSGPDVLASTSVYTTIVTPDWVVNASTGWVITDYPAVSGTIAVSAGDDAFLGTGTFFASSTIQGTIAQTQGDDTSAVTGTHTAPPTILAILNYTQAGDTGLVVGATAQYVADFVVTQGSDTGSATGELSVPDFTGSLVDSTAESDTGLMVGSFYAADIKVGSSYTIQFDQTGLFAGTVTNYNVEVFGTPGASTIRGERVGSLSRHGRVGSKRKIRA